MGRGDLSLESVDRLGGIGVRKSQGCIHHCLPSFVSNLVKSYCVSKVLLLSPICLKPCWSYLTLRLVFTLRLSS